MSRPSSSFLLAETSPAKGLALMLEVACEDFEVLQRLIRQETKLISNKGQEDYRAAARVRMVLAKSFIFHIVRARRICERAAGLLNVDRADRKRFLNATAKVLPVRDVNEHGFDPDGDSKPSMHEHIDAQVIADETSMVIFSDQQIIIGPLNISDMYPPTDRMRKIAGFSSFREINIKEGAVVD